ncbi:hypothetical protein EMIT019CA3_10125 [Bacillus pseudomycoides]
MLTFTFGYTSTFFIFIVLFIYIPSPSHFPYHAFYKQTNTFKNLNVHLLTYHILPQITIKNS